jgi:hypothetical protein
MTHTYLHPAHRCTNHARPGGQPRLPSLPSSPKLLAGLEPPSPMIRAAAALRALVPLTRSYVIRENRELILVSV